MDKALLITALRTLQQRNIEFIENKSDKDDITYFKQQNIEIDAQCKIIAQSIKLEASSC